MATAKDDNVTINTKYKDRLFCLLFGDEGNKENILSLYNALNQTNYTDVSDVEITTIDDVIYIKMKNDVSVLIDSYLSLWEQQSTFNPNMPLRGLMYFGKLYSRYIRGNGINIYGKTFVKIPTPKYVVLYNGAKNRPAVEKLRLSNAFIHDSQGEFEWTATMLNLNKGKNDALLNSCKVLSDYMELINKIRLYQKTMSFQNAVNAAIDDCIANDILTNFLIVHRAEVLDVCITEYDEKTFVAGIKQEGIEEERIRAIQTMISKNFTKEVILSLNYTEEEYAKALTVE